MSHAVEIDHDGPNDASVAYVGATPSTPTNVAYMKEQVKAFVAGEVPLDFKRPHSGNESELKGWKGEEAILSGEEGRRAMGFYL